MTKGLGRANMNLQLNEWAYQDFLGAVIDEDTVQALEYLDLIKKDKYRDTWITSLENELGRLAQGIRNVK